MKNINKLFILTSLFVLLSMLIGCESTELNEEGQLKDELIAELVKNSNESKINFKDETHLEIYMIYNDEFLANLKEKDINQEKLYNTYNGYKMLKQDLLGSNLVKEINYNFLNEVEFMENVLGDYIMLDSENNIEGLKLLLNKVKDKETGVISYD